MVTMTVQIPNAQVGWFEQMVRNLGWSFSKSDTHSLDETKTQKANSNDLIITPALRRKINHARKEYAEGQTVSCKTPQEMQHFFDNL